MSVPPLVCSTPPPPDQIDEEEYNDEFSINYEDSSTLSPSHQYGQRAFSIPDSPVVKDSSPDFSCTNSHTSTSNNPGIVPIHELQNDKSEDSSKLNIDFSESSQSAATVSKQLEISKNKPNDSQRNVEENNIEDLDLKLDSLQIDFQNGKESVEDSLNSTFDDFGTFLSSSVLNESIDDTFYLPKSNDSQTSDLRSEKEPKTHEVSSDDSVSIPIDDNSDFDVGWENPNDHTDTEIVDDFQHCVYDSSADFPEISKDTSAFVNDVTIDTLSVVLESSFSSSLDSPDSKSVLSSVESPKDVCDQSSDFQHDVLPSSENTTSEDILLEKTLNTEADVSSDFNIIPEIKIDSEELFSGFQSDVNQIDDILVKKLSETIEIDSQLSTETTNNDSFAPFTVDDEEATKESTVNLEVQNHIPNTANVSDSAIDDDFDDFATFQTADVIQTTPKSQNENEPINETIITEDVTFNAFIESSEINHDNLPAEISNDAEISDSDEFGDFGTYDPSEEPVQDQCFTPVIPDSSKSFHSFQISEFVDSSDSDIFEKLCHAINNIFPEENSDCEETEEKELRSVLGENWKHLKKCEAEQSYLFPWNNSTSQKSLLRSLGIDSRNILFGPKWNSSMPRFAANLGVSPLQPIKQPASAMSSSLDYHGEDKPSGSDLSGNPPHTNLNNWDNPANFSAADLQASSYAESLLLDLEHLMATLDQMTSGQSAHFKISDLFTNACNERGDDHLSVSHPYEHAGSPEASTKVEPKSHPTSLNIGRKINLPDTHIFTPTDSKTPWSHTIHYDDTKNDQSQDSSIKDFVLPLAPLSPSIQIAKSSDDMDDFDEFQAHTNFSSNSLETSIGATFETTDFEANFSNVDVVNQDTASLNFVSAIQPNSETTEVSADFDDFGDFHSADLPKSFTQLPLPPLQASSLLEPVKISPAIPVVNWPEPGEVKILGFDELPSLETLPSVHPAWSHDTASTVSYEVPYPCVPTAPKSFILKESKIGSDDFATTLNSNNDSAESEPFDDFTDFKSAAVNSSQYFQSNAKPPSVFNLNPTLNTAKTVFPASVDSSADDFDDFQSVEYNPSYVSKTEKDVTNPTSTYFPTNPNLPPNQDYTVKPQVGYQASPAPLPAFNQFIKLPLEPATLQRAEDSNSKNTSQQILQPLSLENYSQINWPDPGIDLQDLSRFNPINSIQTYSEPKENSSKSNNVAIKSPNEDDGWSDFVSIKPSNSGASKNAGSNSMSYNQTLPPNFSNNTSTEDGEDWSEFVSSAVLPSRSYSNEVKTISQNIHSHGNSSGSGYLNSKTFNSSYIGTPIANAPSSNPGAPSISSLPHLSYVSSKANNPRTYNNHFQNL